MEGLPQGLQPLLLGNLNADLAHPWDAQSRAVATKMANYGLEDMLQHYRQRRGSRHGNTWSQHRNGERVSSRCDYILGMDRRMFSNVSLRDPRLFSSDHLMVLGKLQSALRTRNRSYLRARTRFPLRAPKNGTRNPSWCAFPSTWLSSNGNSSSNLFVVLADREERLIWFVDTKGTTIVYLHDESQSFSEFVCV